MLPKGFWSYARGDDQHMDRLITDLRAQVVGEISTLFGEEVGMFQDVYDIRTGEDWKERLKEELNDASFMIPVLTPRYFERQWCREEIIEFINLSEQKGVQAFLFPIYLVPDRKFDAGNHCQVREAVSKYQHFDFRELRFESDRSIRDKSIFDFAKDVLESIENQGGGTSDEKFSYAVLESLEPSAIARSKVPEKGNENEITSKNELEEVSEWDVEPSYPRHSVTTIARVAQIVEDATVSITYAQARAVFQSGKRSQRKLSVNPVKGAADYTNLSDAIAECNSWDVVLVSPGVYRENIVVDKPIEMIAEGPGGAVEVSSESGNTLEVVADHARIRNFHFKRDVGSGNDAALYVSRGSPKFEDCVFISRSVLGVAIEGPEATPNFLNCTFSGADLAGVMVSDFSKPKFETCNFSKNTGIGIAVLRCADPFLKLCVIAENEEYGVAIGDYAGGNFEDCSFSNNAVGVFVSLGGSPRVFNGSFRHNRKGAFQTGDEFCSGSLERCSFFDNGSNEISLAQGSESRVSIT